MDSIAIGSLFDAERLSSTFSRLFLLLYVPIGFVIFIIRIFIGIQAFIAACLLRKSTALRCAVLRIMCCVLGIVVRQEGSRAPKVKMMCANHVSPLDHLAIDLLEPCILPSVWDIPSVLRWCFGYVDLGARQGRSELIRLAQNHISNEELPILSFPEGAITNGRMALLKFSSWPMEVSPLVQPVALSIWRPVDVKVALLGSAWYNDVFWFLALPFSVIHVHWLPIMTRNDEEPIEDFAVRVSTAIANDLGIRTSTLTNHDAVEAAKRHARALNQRSSSGPSQARSKKILDPKRLDELAMRIKQLHPAIPLLAIRNDLEKTKDQNETIERIKHGKIVLDVGSSSMKTGNSADWRRLFDFRKWEMIEKNRSRYLTKITADVASGDN